MKQKLYQKIFYYIIKAIKTWRHKPRSHGIKAHESHKFILKRD